MCYVFFLVYFDKGNKKDWIIKWIPLRVIYAAIVMLFLVPCIGFIFIYTAIMAIPFFAIKD